MFILTTEHGIEMCNQIGWTMRRNEVLFAYGILEIVNIETFLVIYPAKIITKLFYMIN